jgi:shikimate kinase
LVKPKDSWAFFLSSRNIAMLEKNIVFLVGFMGAGKSTIGPLLAHALKWKFIDLDKEIEKSENRPIRSIFSEVGEAYFRRLETEAIRDLVSKRPCVVALGGGATIQEANRLLVHELGYTVFLDCALEVILKRCPKDGSRPLWQSHESVAALYAARLPYYNMSDIRVDATHQTPEQIAKAVLVELKAGRIADAL